MSLRHLSFQVPPPPPKDEPSFPMSVFDDLTEDDAAFEEELDSDRTPSPTPPPVPLKARSVKVMGSEEGLRHLHLSKLHLRPQGSNSR